MQRRTMLQSIGRTVGASLLAAAGIKRAKAALFACGEGSLVSTSYLESACSGLRQGSTPTCSTAGRNSLATSIAFTFTSLCPVGCPPAISGPVSCDCQISGQGTVQALVICTPCVNNQYVCRGTCVTPTCSQCGPTCQACATGECCVNGACTSSRGGCVGCP